VNLREQLPKYLDGQVKLVCTACTLAETEGLGPELYGALQVLKTFAVTKCHHPGDKAVVSAPKCILSMIRKAKAKDKNEDGDDKREDGEVVTRYIVATQDFGLRVALQELPGVPLIQLFASAPALEKPSGISYKFVEDKTMKKMEVMDYQKEILDHMKKKEFGEEAEGNKKGTRKRKRAGPNPLSCKKSKKANNKLATNKGMSNSEGVAKKKKRKRVRMPKHVKAELLLGIGQ
jgi:U3 small nucleolar RNA-associated protein 23